MGRKIWKNGVLFTDDWNYCVMVFWYLACERCRVCFLPAKPYVGAVDTCKPGRYGIKRYFSVILCSWVNRLLACCHLFPTRTLKLWVAVVYCWFYSLIGKNTNALLFYFFYLFIFFILFFFIPLYIMCLNLLLYHNYSCITSTPKFGLWNSEKEKENSSHWPCGQSVRQWSGRPGFNPRSSQTKDF